MADEHDSFFSDSIHSTRSSTDSESPLIGDEERLIYELQNRDRPDNTKGSSFSAYINITCLMAGIGVLGLPEALNKGGWVALGLIVISMLITLYTSVIIIKCLYHNGKSRLSTYGEIGYDAFGTFGKYLVEFFHNITLIGVSVLYFILAAENFDTLAHHYDISWGVKIWTCICAAFISIPFIFAKTLKEVAIISIFGTFSTLFCIVAIVILSFKDWSNSPDPPSYKILDLSGIPISLATISFSYGGNNVFPQIEESMRKPGHWNRTVTAALCTCASMYFLVAFSGYLVYGDKSVNPILNALPKGLLLTSATILITIHVLLTIPILLTTFAMETENHLNITRQHHSKIVEFLLRGAFRLLLILIVVGIAVTVPYFDDIMSLLGALATCLFVFVLPVLFYLKLFGWERMSFLMLSWNLFVLIVGLIGCVVGSISAINRLFEDFIITKN